MNTNLEWYSRCYDCTYKRWHGSSKSDAQIAANKHWRKHRGHRTTYGEDIHPDELKAMELRRKLGE